MGAHAASSPGCAGRRTWSRPRRAARPASSAARRTSTATWHSWLKISSPARPMKSQYISSTSAPAAFQGVADGGADDGAFGDRRVEQAVVGQRLGQAAIDGERAAPVAVLLAVGDQRRVDVEAVEDRLEDARRGCRRTCSWAACCPSSSNAERLRWASCLTRGFSSLGMQHLGLARRCPATRPSGWRTSSARAGSPCSSGRRAGEIVRSTAFL